MFNNLFLTNISTGVVQLGTVSDVNPYDKSGEDWTVVDIDNWIVANSAIVGKDVILPNVARSYYSTTAFTTMDANNTVTYIGATLADTDAIIEWYADWSEAESITQTTIDMINYDGYTSAAETDIARFATAENENSFINLTALDLSVTMTITSLGTGGPATLKLECSEDVELTLDNNAYFTDASGVGTDQSYTLQTGALRTFYIRCQSGTATFTVADGSKITAFGSTSFNVHGWESGATECELEITPSEFTNVVVFSINTYSNILGDLNNNVTFFRVLGNASYTNFTAIPTSCTYLQLGGLNVKYSSGDAMPTGLTYLSISLFDKNDGWTGLDIPGSGDITTLNLANYRLAKMSSADMVTLLTNLTNRTGDLPATITINDYADYASPPQSVTDAVSALIAAKSTTTVNLGQ